MASWRLALVTALLLGLAPYLQQHEVFVAIALSGAVILLWLAFGMFRSLPTLTLRLESGAPQHGNLIITGIVLSAVNPYWVIWWATIGFGYILHSRLFGLAGILVFLWVIFLLISPGTRRYRALWPGGGDSSVTVSIAGSSDFAQSCSFSSQDIFLCRSAEDHLLIFVLMRLTDNVVPEIVTGRSHAAELIRQLP